jgi:hypothetical protein
MKRLGFELEFALESSEGVSVQELKEMSQRFLQASRDTDLDVEEGVKREDWKPPAAP